MKLCSWGKDGGPESKVWGFWLVEIKSLFSVVLLKFERGSRPAYHEHAFDCFSWVLKGYLFERFKNRIPPRWHFRRWKPFVTYRTDFHKVTSYGTTWVLSIRGPWADSWREYDETTKETYTLTNGRKVA